MSIDIGTLGEIEGVHIGDDEVRCIFIGNSLLYAAASPPTQHIISSSVSGGADPGMAVVFTSMVTDNDLTGGRYAWYVDGVERTIPGGELHPHNTFTYNGDDGNGVSREIQCIFTDNEGLSLESNVLTQQWLETRPMTITRTFTPSGVSGNGSRSAIYDFTWEGTGTATFTANSGFGSAGGSYLQIPQDGAGTFSTHTTSPASSSVRWQQATAVEVQASGVVTVRVPEDDTYAETSISLGATGAGSASIP